MSPMCNGKCCYSSLGEPRQVAMMREQRAVQEEKAAQAEALKAKAVAQADLNKAVVEAERDKQVAVLKAEAENEKVILQAEAEKQKVVLAAEAKKRSGGTGGPSDSRHRYSHSGIGKAEVYGLFCGGS